MYSPFLSTPNFIPGSVGSMGSLIAFQPLVGSGDSETARYPTERCFNSAMTANQRWESGSYSRRGSFSLGKLKAGLVVFQNSVCVIRRITLPVFLSWITTLALVKSTTWFGPTAPLLSGASLGPGPVSPGNVVKTVTPGSAVVGGFWLPARRPISSGAGAARLAAGASCAGRHQTATRQHPPSAISETESLIIVSCQQPPSPSAATGNAPACH